MILTLFSAAVFLLDFFVFKGKSLSTIFSCPGAKTVPPFDFKNPLEYFRLIFHIFGSYDVKSFLINLLILLFIGQEMEARFGHPLLIIMILLSSLVAGVANISFGSNLIFGLQPVAFLLLFLNISVFIIEGEWKISKILVFAAYTFFVVHSVFDTHAQYAQSATSFVSWILGGIFSGALGFLVSPKKSNAKPVQKVREKSKAKKTVTEKKSRRKIKEAKIDDDVPTETVIGTL